MSVRTGILAASVLCANALVGPRLAKAGRAHGIESGVLHAGPAEKGPSQESESDALL
jgi:hypothetical protein